MKTRFWALVSLSTLGVTLVGNSVTAGDQTNANGPRIKCSTENFNYGYVPQGATVSHTYWLHNTGSETVTIKQLKPNCGCTQVPPTDSSISPGDSLPVEVLFGSRNMSGKVEKFTRIVSNAQGRVPALAFVAHVAKPDEISGPVVASPAIVELDGSGVGRTKITNKSDLPMTVRVVDVPPVIIHLNTNEITLAPDESKELSIEASLSKTATEFTKSITVEANDANSTRLTIPITVVKRE